MAEGGETAPSEPRAAEAGEMGSTFVDTLPNSQAADAGEAGGERQGGRRRNRRGGRGRDRDEARGGERAEQANEASTGSEPGDSAAGSGDAAGQTMTAEASRAWSGSDGARGGHGDG